MLWRVAFIAEPCFLLTSIGECLFQTSDCLERSQGFDLLA